jgi:hypothetical protein
LSLKHRFLKGNIHMTARTRLSIVIMVFVFTGTLRGQNPDPIWGEAVDGVQLHLALLGETVPGDLPMLEAGIRNGSGAEISMGLFARDNQWSIQVDGVWYRYQSPVPYGGGGHGCVVVPSGAVRIEPVMPVQSKDLVEAAATSPTRLALRPGTHLLRLRTTFCTSSASEPVLVSNAVTIETSDVSQLQAFLDGFHRRGPTNTPSKQAATFMVPADGTLFIQCVGGSAGATSQFGIGSSPDSFAVYLKDVPQSCPSLSVPIGDVKAGETMPFAIRTEWGGQTFWAFASGVDTGSAISFGGVLEPAGPDSWILHLSDAAHYTVGLDPADNILIQVRLLRR